MGRRQGQRSQDPRKRGPAGGGDGRAGAGSGHGSRPTTTGARRSGWEYALVAGLLLGLVGSYLIPGRTGQWIGLGGFLVAVVAGGVSLTRTVRARRER